MPEILKPIPVAFWRSAAGREPVREWLNELPREDKRIIGRDIAKVQFGWPMGLPLCRPLSGGLWEVRSALPSRRQARVFFGFHDGMLIALHAINHPVRACHHQKDAENAGGRIGAGKTEIEGGAVMARKNPHIGSSFESWLKEAGIREGLTAAAT